MADTVEGLVKAEQWLMSSRLPGHEASAINAASAIQVAREAIAALEARALAAEAQRDKAIEALKPFKVLADCTDSEPDGASVIVNVNRARDARSTLNEIAP